MHSCLISKAVEYAKPKYAKNDENHRWNHVEAVLKRSKEIYSELKYPEIDLESLNLAIIFHDIDYSFPRQHVENSVLEAIAFLKENHRSNLEIAKVLQIMLAHSTPHRKKFGDSDSLEGKIIYDADKSLLINDFVSYKKYRERLYLEETRNLVVNRLFDNWV